MENLLANINEPESVGPAKPVLVGGAVLLIVLGGLTGFFLANRSSSMIESPLSSTEVKAGKEIGSTDTRIFKDTATGVLEEGGMNGEGTHKLLREGGPSQTAYLTSSVVDLDKFVGKKIQVWGETYRGQKVGWLMDVGRVKVLE